MLLKIIPLKDGEYHVEDEHGNLIYAAEEYYPTYIDPVHMEHFIRCVNAEHKQVSRDTTPVHDEVLVVGGSPLATAVAAEALHQGIKVVQSAPIPVLPIDKCLICGKDAKGGVCAPESCANATTGLPLEQELYAALKDMVAGYEELYSSDPEVLNDPAFAEYGRAKKACARYENNGGNDDET